MADGGGGVALSAPPVTGLGNFKGVMLCNRPSDGPASRPGMSDGPLPFKSMVSATHGEQLGLPPCKPAEGAEPTRGVKKRGPSAALRQHVRWLRDLQCQMKGERDTVTQEEVGEEERKRRMRAAAEKHREGVRIMISERQEAREAAAKQDDLKVAAVAADGKDKKKKKVVKPLWALTEKEKEDFFDDEANELINFADGLDIDKYLGDMEFRQGFDALKDRAGKLAKEQEAFKDSLVAEFNAALEEDATTCSGTPRSSVRLEDGIDGQSVLAGSEYSSGSRRSRGEREQRRAGEKPDWDSSTACGEERPQADRDLKDAAAMVLESAPQIKAIHSKESIARIIERARAAQEQPGLIAMMKREGPTMCPVITASADTQQRLHKPVDPSNLPYLYRSPAI